MSWMVASGEHRWSNSARTMARYLLALAVLAGGCRTPSVRDEGEGATEQAFTVSRPESVDSGSAANAPARLEIPGPQGSMPCEVYPLKNQDPAQLAESLSMLAQPGEDAPGRVIIVPDRVTRSLIVRAGPEDQEWIAGLIRRLDDRPQVLIDCMLLEVTNNDEFAWRLSLIGHGTEPFHATGTATEPNASAGARPQGHGERDLFYDDKQVESLLTDMATRDYGRVLAKPRVVAGDLGEGLIELKETIHATGASGADSPYAAGITLEVTPHIIDRGMLQLGIMLTRSDLLKTHGAKPPDTVFTKIDTALTLPEGRTAILGGMRRLNRGKSKVPVLGDIPVAGALFRRGNGQDAQSRLYLLIKAQVLRPDDAP